jgi:hypothetical protein
LEEHTLVGTGEHVRAQGSEVGGAFQFLQNGQGRGA